MKNETLSLQAPLVHIAQYLDDTAARLPDQVAIVDADGEELTYRRLSEIADRIADFLHRRGVVAGDRVGIVMRKTSLSIAAMFGILRLNAAYVPVDADGAIKRIAHILDDCRVHTMLVSPELAPCVISSCPQFEGKIAVIDPGTYLASDVGATCVFLNGDAPSYPRAALDAKRLAYILYTSGSTGVPKGVEITHENAMSFIEWASSAFGVTEDDHLSSHAPFHFDLSVFDIYVSVKNGACLHLIDADMAISPKHLNAFILRRGITVWYSAPAILGILAAYYSNVQPVKNKLRLVLFAGEVFPIAKLRLLKFFWPDAEYYNLYGPTETNVCTFYRVPDDIPESRIEPLPIGLLCAHCEAIVIDERQCETEKTGLLCIAGPSVANRYWNAPEEMAKKTIRYKGRRWYNTGDRVRFSPSEGFIFLGRQDRMVKRNGYRIELDEIETCLAAHGALCACAVVSTTQDGETIITAFAIARHLPVPAWVLARYCCNQLAKYMVPDRFYYLDDLPLTSTNKTDYRALEALCLTTVMNDV